MSKELETYNEFLDIIEFPVKSHLLNSNDKPTLERYRVLRTQIETALKDYEKIKKEVKDLRKAFYEQCDKTIKLCNNYEKQLKALEFIKELFIFQPNQFYPFVRKDLTKIADKEKINLLKEVLL